MRPSRNMTAGKTDARQPELTLDDEPAAWSVTTPFMDYLENAEAEVVRDFLSSPPGSKQSWTTVPSSEINRLWNEYAKWGHVRDAEALARVIEQFKENVAKLEANNVLCGHADHGPEYDDLGLDEDDHEQMERFYFWVKEISDYGAGPLVRLAYSLDEARTAEEAILILDRMLNVVHQRSDLSALFVEGGAGTLDRLFSQEGPSPSFRGRMESSLANAVLPVPGNTGTNTDETLDRPNVWPSPQRGPSPEEISRIPGWWKRKASTWWDRASGDAG